jgi:hypothetical protein
VSYQVDKNVLRGMSVGVVLLFFEAILLYGTLNSEIAFLGIAGYMVASLWVYLCLPAAIIFSERFIIDFDLWDGPHTISPTIIGYLNLLIIHALLGGIFQILTAGLPTPLRKVITATIFIIPVTLYAIIAILYLVAW